MNKDKEERGFLCLIKGRSRSCPVWGGSNRARFLF